MKTPHDLLNNYTITPENLWAVFFTPTDFSQSSGAPPVMHVLELASPGSMGLEEIKAASGPDLLLALSLQDIRVMRQRFFPASFEKGCALLTQTSSGAFDLLVSHHQAPHKALREMSRIHPDRVVMVVGLVDDFFSLCDEMEAVFLNQDFNKIGSDRRHFDADLPEPYVFLLAKSSPPAAWALDEILNR